MRTIPPGMEPKPRWVTRDGYKVHLRAVDHLPGDSVPARFNKRVAIAITGAVGTMWCAYAFALIALAGLPAAIQQSTAGGHFQPLPVVQWVAQTFLQLVLLSVIIVGQNIQAAASDARAAKEFEDTEIILGMASTQRELLAANTALTQQVHDLAKVIHDKVTGAG